MTESLLKAGLHSSIQSQDAPDPRLFFMKAGEPRSLEWLKPHGISAEHLRFDSLPFAVQDGFLTLPMSGIYTGHTDQLSIVFVVEPETIDDKIDLAFSFIAAHVTGATPEPDTIPDDMCQFLSALFMNPRCVDFNCGPASSLLRAMLYCMNVRARWVWWANTKELHPHRQHHVTLEAWHSETKTWQLIDVHNGLLFQSGFSALDFSLCDTVGQKMAIKKSLPKSFFKLDDLDTYDSSARVFAVQRQDSAHISPINPNVTQALHAEFLVQLSDNLVLFPLEEFRHQASYNA